MLKKTNNHTKRFGADFQVFSAHRKCNKNVRFCAAGEIKEKCKINFLLFIVFQIVSLIWETLKMFKKLLDLNVGFFAAI